MYSGLAVAPAAWYNIQKTRSTDMAKKEFSIDQGFEQLDDILKKLGSEDVKLSDAVKLYSEGVSVVKECKDSLDQVEKELIILNENGEENEV